MPSLICRICLETLHDRTMVTTKCGHIFCSTCARAIFKRSRATCPVCRRSNTYSQLIRLFPEWESSMDENDANQSRKSDTRMSHAPLPPSTAVPAAPPEPEPIEYIPNLYIPLGLDFPWQIVGEIPAWDSDGSPVYLGTTLLDDGWHPCKIIPNSPIRTRVSYIGFEIHYEGICSILPFNSTTMEWVPTSRGLLPPGRRVVEGGYEELGGNMLYHALAVVDGIKIPGKTGTHMIRGASIPYNNLEYIVHDYEILCWRDY